MKKFIVFAGERHNPMGGLRDLVGFANTVDEAIALVQQKDTGFWEWAHLVEIASLESGKPVVVHYKPFGHDWILNE